MKVFTNADTPVDVRDARARDAQAHDVQRVGLTRTESCGWRWHFGAPAHPDSTGGLVRGDGAVGEVGQVGGAGRDRQVWQVVRLQGGQDDQGAAWCAAARSFGTNNLTQMTFGAARDDEAKFLPYYVKYGVLEKDPFETEGVGELVRLTVERGRVMRPMTEVCIFGEHAATPDEDAG
ncbi:hypothetical protein PR003_g31670 [Phytophthora rubi]|uniref:PEP-utilising enzyme C-terminal domain-containing protein n=2 Tax=Phytophthora rubi TaxID=129364 RepID=A0A6A4B281_9STRA|nr:hypothetical protein PR003_g31670 [Phytophthora rubi]